MNTELVPDRLLSTDPRRWKAVGYPERYPASGIRGFDIAINGSCRPNSLNDAKFPVHLSEDNTSSRFIIPQFNALIVASTKRHAVLDGR